MADLTAHGTEIPAKPEDRRPRPPIPIPPPDRDRENKPEPVLIDASVKKVHSSLLLRIFLSRRFWLIFSILFIIAAFITIPYMFWLNAPELDLRIAVVNKTVPYDDYREHRALFWLFKQNKFIDTAKDEVERWYEEEYDFIGFDPVDPPEQFRTTLLSDENLADRDVLFLADTYGVYDYNYAEPDAPKEDTIGSAKLFGGLEEEEVAAIENFAARSKLIIGEFNCFASPTTEDLRARMEHLFGVTWTGWAGRFIADFEDEDDVPDWIRVHYTEDTGHQWDLKGSGYIMIDLDGNYLILQTNTDLEREHINLPHQGLEFIPVSNYIEEDVMQGVQPCTYANWFDIVEAQENTQVLAEYEFHVTNDGRRKLIEAGLPLKFPAVTLRTGEFTHYEPPVDEDTGGGTMDGEQPAEVAEETREPAAESVPARQRNGLLENEGYRAYYLAGDMLDHSDAMGNPKTRLTMYINRSYYGRPVVGSHAYFFWHTYYPMVSNILRKECFELTRSPRNIFMF